MNKVAKVLQKVEDTIMVVTFAVMALCIFGAVLNRNFIQSPGLGWFEELAKYAQVFMVMVGTEIGLRDNTQIRITALVDKLKGRAKLIVQIISQIIIVGFVSIMFYYGVKLVLMQVKLGQTTPMLHWPMTIPYSALVIGFGAMVLVQGWKLIRMFVALVKNEPFEVEETAAEQEA